MSCAVAGSRVALVSAVVRNRIRRRLYEALRQMDGQIKSPHDIVLTVFNDAVVTEDYAKLSKQLAKQLREAGLITE
jgi:ribonuclease P protein component